MIARKSVILPMILLCTHATKINPDKFHLLVSGNFKESVSIQIGGEHIQESKEELLLGITLDNQLKFKHQIDTNCKQAGGKLTAIIRECHSISFDKLKPLLLSFVESQFNYCPLVLMFCTRTENKRINRIQERSLRILYRDETSSFEELLEKDCSFTVHQRSIQKLAIEMYKSKNNYEPKLLNDIFVSRVYEGPILRSNTDFIKPKIKSENFGRKSLSYFGNIIWNLVPTEFKELSSLEKFKQKIINWKPDNCPCKLCIPYVQGLGYINVSN